MWKPIQGYEGIYEVSDSGEVRSLDRFVLITRGRYAGSYKHLRGVMMKQTEAQSSHNNPGYYVVNLHKNGISKVEQVHILVANAFIPNINNLPTINHIDGNKHNNNVENLEWASYSDNNQHAIDTGLRHPRGVAVVQYDGEGNVVAVYKSVTEASRKTGFSRGMLSHAVNGRAKTVGNYVWRKQSESQTTIPFGSTQEDEFPAEAQRPHNSAEDIVYAVSNNG